MSKILFAIMKDKNRTIRRLELLFFLCLFVFSTILTLKQHQGRGILNWQSEIWADMAGYYVYLPATFYYHFDARKAPAGIDEKSGNGFFLDHSNNKVVTGYFYGVSLLVSPFFFAAHAVSVIAGNDEMGGFSLIYNKAFDVASVFYLVLGLFFLKRFLRNYFSEYLQYILILLTFLGTNLFYYSIEVTLMSHVYSFFVIAVFLYSMKEFLKDTSGYRHFLLMAIAFGIMLVIRPTNCFIGLIFLFWDLKSAKEIVTRIKMILQPKYIFLLLAIMFVMFIPQMVFWKIMRGTFFYAKYGEGFPFWNQPKLVEVWFSTLNGLVPWSPLMLFFMSGMLFAVCKKYSNGILILSFFLLISYMAAAYRFWYYGCGYGHRAFIEFMPVFCIPFGFLIRDIFNSKKIVLQVLFVLSVVFMTYFNARLSLVADKCNFGSTWDWDYYVRQINRIHLFPQSSLPSTFRNDFENDALNNGTKLTDSVKHSGAYSAVIDPQHEFSCNHTSMIWDFNGKYPGFIRVKLLVKKAKPGIIGALIVCSFVKNDTVVNTQSQPLEPFTGETSSWFTVLRTFNVPVGLPGDSRMNFYIWNKEKNTFFLDDLNIRYE